MGRSIHPEEGIAMPTFDTPEPVSATIDVVVGDVRIGAGERTDTVVAVRPRDPADEHDRRAAEGTLVECDGRRLLVRAPRPRPWFARNSGAIDVAIELPAGSEVDGVTQVGRIDCDGPLGPCRMKTGLGNVRLERAETLTVKSGSGEVSVDHATGHAEVSSGSGDVRLRELAGTAVVKSSNGDTWVGTAGGDLRVVAANGSIAVDVAQAGVVAKTANGGVRVGDVTRGTVVLETAMGDVEVGIREGTAAWLDVRTTTGRVRNALDTAGERPDTGETVEVRARTHVGDVVIRRP
jgi:putative adhesin